MALIKERPEDSDVFKYHAWDIPANNVAELTAWLARQGMTVEHFKTLPVYKGNVKRLPWLKGL